MPSMALDARYPLEYSLDAVAVALRARLSEKAMDGQVAIRRSYTPPDRKAIILIRLSAFINNLLNYITKHFLCHIIHKFYIANVLFT